MGCYMQHTVIVALSSIGDEHTLFVDDEDDAPSKRKRLFLGLVTWENRSGIERNRRSGLSLSSVVRSWRTRTQVD